MIEFGIKIKARDLQRWNTKLLIVVTDSATFTLPIFLGSVPVPSYMYGSSSVRLIGQDWVVTRAQVMSEF